MTTFLLVVVAVEAVALVLVTVLYRRARASARAPRRVEAPNSEFKSRYVVDLESRERWERMELSRLHEVNREEVEKLLRKVRATGVRSLAPGERAFLDRMADAHDRGTPGGRTAGGPPRPRHARGTS